MKTHDAIGPSEVRRVCKEIGIRDWSKIKKPNVSLSEAKKILKRLDLSGMKIDPEQFRIGLEVELEHGAMFPPYNVTNNHPILTGKIVMAHFMEMLDYYRRLEVAELEGDLFKSMKAKNIAKARKYYSRVLKAKERLARAEASGLK